MFFLSTSPLFIIAPQFQTLDNQVIIPIVNLEKTSRPSRLRSEVVLPSGDNFSPLSLSLCLRDYLARTEEARVYYEKAEGFRPKNMFVSIRVLCLPLLPTGSSLPWTKLALTLPHTVQTQRDWQVPPTWEWRGCLWLKCWNVEIGPTSLELSLFFTTDLLFIRYLL